jgi:hypothetical protein
MSASKEQQAGPAQAKGTSVGYELHIRTTGPDKAIDGGALAARLDALQASGVPELPTPPVAVPATPATAAATPPAAPAPVPAATPAPAVASSLNPGPWSAKNGKGHLDVRLCFVDKILRGADFDVAFGGSEDEMRRAFACVVQTAEAVGVVVFDPQLGREVGRGAADEVVARWRQSQDWMVDVAGNYDDRRSLGEFAARPPLVNRSTKIVLVIIGGFIAIYWLIGTIADLLR